MTDKIHDFLKHEFKQQQVTLIFKQTDIPLLEIYVCNKVYENQTSKDVVLLFDKENSLPYKGIKELNKTFFEKFDDPQKGCLKNYAAQVKKKTDEFLDKSPTTRPPSDIEDMLSLKIFIG